MKIQIFLIQTTPGSTIPSQPGAEIPQIPQLGSLPMLTRHLSYRLEDYLRLMEQRRIHMMNRGASKDTIEKNTFPHKYKRVSISIVIIIVQYDINKYL